MDKQRIIEIAHEIARRNEEKLGHNNPQHIRMYGEPVRMIKLIDSGITDFVAAILLEAAKVCDRYETQDGITNTRLGWSATTTPPVVIADELREIAKELTQ